MNFETPSSKAFTEAIGRDREIELGIVCRTSAIIALNY